MCLCMGAYKYMYMFINTFHHLPAIVRPPPDVPIEVTLWDVGVWDHETEDPWATCLIGL